jgi:hypothetical protein
MVNGIKVPLTEVEIADFNQRAIDHEAQLIEDAKVKYKLDRAAEYPLVEEQLDIIFHGGIDVWKAAIQAIKDKYPKPE